MIPAAAESWSVDASGKVWTFKLSKGLQWSDGTPLTAADYEATFRYSVEPSSAWNSTSGHDSTIFSLGNGVKIALI